MLNFLKSIIVTTISLLLCFFVLVGILVFFAIKSSNKQEQVPDIQPNSVLKIDLSMPIAERSVPETPFDRLNPNSETALGLNDLIAGIEHAATDDNVKGIYLELSTVSAGMASLEEVRNAIVNFKEKAPEKFVISYGELISQKTYYVASVADKIYLNPSGIVELKGFGTELSFFKNALDRLGVEPEVFYAGNFKSATEPFRYNKMSDYNRLQTRELLSDISDNFKEKVAKSRKMSPQQLTDIINNLKVRRPKDAENYKIIDGQRYFDEVLAELKQNVGIEPTEKLETISISKYAKTIDPNLKHNGKDQIAIIYAEGDIVDGKGNENNIGSERFAKTIRKARENEDTKAIVMRINSPGGSALASEVIWRELQLCKQKGIPIIASMSDVAASGGYYIAAPANKIFAQKNTITGSIGVFGMLLQTQKFMDNKLGITFDTVSTAPFATFPNSALVNKNLSNAEKQIMQQGVDDIYQQFLTRVAEGRNKTPQQIHEVAQGRVWTGTQAIQKGLVDQIGGINEAIAEAAKQAQLNNDYSVAEYPHQKSQWELVISEITGEEAQSRWLKKQIGNELYNQYQNIENIKNLTGIQTRIPANIEIK